MGFRYHVMTIAAIFLALGVGIVIGSSYVQGHIVDRTAKSLGALRNQFETQVVPVREKNQQYGDYVAGLPLVLRGTQLAGARVALIQTGDYEDTVRKIQDTLEQSGLQVTSVTTIDRTFPTKSQLEIGKLLPALRASHPSLPADKSAILRVLASAIVRGGEEKDLSALADSKLIDRSGDYTAGVSYVVLVGGAGEDQESRAKEVDAPLIAELKALGVTVVAAEPETAAISYIPDLREAEIATVDNADTDIGRVAVALALRAPAGDYGTKRTARSGILPVWPPPQ